MKTLLFRFSLPGVLFLLTSAMPVFAATITVSNTNDSGAGSLRQAIANANPGDIIDFNLTYPATITLTSGLLIIDKNLTIGGPGANNLTLNGNNASRVISISVDSIVSISGVTIVNGNTVSADYDGGGGMYNAGNLTVTNSAFRNNRDPILGGYGGGGIGNIGTLTVMSSTFQSNSSPQSGGGAIASAGTADITNCMFSDNTGSLGGAITGRGTMNVMNSTFNGNIATTSGGGGSGGAINIGWATLAVFNSTFTGNRSVGAFGQGGGGGIRIISGSTIVSNTTFFNNSTNNYGGGIEIYEGSLWVQNSTFLGNSANSAGGGINNFYDPGYTASVYIANTIIANSTHGGNCGGPIGSYSTNNLSTDSTCSPGFTQVTPAQLALGSLTGSPAYFPLTSGSAAIDTGSGLDCPSTDQRGVVRPQDGNNDGTATCDIGSYEAVFSALTNKLYLPLILR